MARKPRGVIAAIQNILSPPAVAAPEPAPEAHEPVAAPEHVHAPAVAHVRQFRYHKTEKARIFEVGEEIPLGWETEPQRDPLDHDGDGKKGGSV